ncbi:MAG: alpha/beta hydrolase-fold protein [Alphaproteobacteria bacterium]
MILTLDIPTTLVSPQDEAVFAAARESDVPEPAVESRLRPDGAEIKLRKGRHAGKAVWPDVERDYWVYVPAVMAGPANLIVFQDGANYLERTNAATALDNLIAAGDLAPTVGLFVDPGDWAGQPKGSRANRSLEYDQLSDAYVRFLTEELFPEALHGLTIADDPKKRAICGMSSGGICAFNAAWERPDLFGLVVSHVGSFTNIRGGHLYPSRVRQNGAKPIRVFLQGGAQDLDNTNGHWPTANVDMAAALRFRGYDMRFEFGKGGHNFEHAAATLPATLRWIFRG